MPHPPLLVGVPAALDCKESSHVMSTNSLKMFTIFQSSPEDMFIDFREKGERKWGRERGRERETWISCLLYTP